MDATDDEDEEGDVAGEEGSGDDRHHQSDPLSCGLPGELEGGDFILKFCHLRF